MKSPLEYSDIKTDHTVLKYTSETDRTVRNSNKFLATKIWLKLLPPLEIYFIELIKSGFYVNLYTKRIKRLFLGSPTDFS